ncbi:MAG: hypothetical protein MUD04_09525 [Cyanobium sp. Prado107]|jgi:hypothetical protein|nr:hypothetical protein [Cyanobium sp. Prado107]
MANITRLLGRPPEDDFDIPYRKPYFRGDGDDSFEMRRQSDFFTSVFAYGGRGKNTASLPFSTDDIIYSSITRGGNVSIQFRTAIGENQSAPQTIHLDGVRSIDLLDTNLRINQLYTRTFNRDLPKQPSERQTRWISNGRWDDFEPKSGDFDALTGKARGANNFYLSGANNDAIVKGSNSRNAIDTLFFDQYESEIEIFPRKPGNVNIRVRFVNVDDAEETHVSLFKAKNLERLVCRDVYFERGGRGWRRFDGQPVGSFATAVDIPEEGQQNFVGGDGDPIFNPIPDIFDPRFVPPSPTDPLA